MRAQVAPRSHIVWLAERTRYAPRDDARGIEVVDDSGAIRAMVVFEDWLPNSVQCHMASESPIAWRHLLPHVFTYPFVQAGRGLLLGLVRSDNPRSMELTSRLGFRRTHAIRDGYAAGVDLVVFEMRKDECLWLKGHPQKEAA